MLGNSVRRGVELEVIVFDYAICLLNAVKRTAIGELFQSSSIEGMLPNLCFASAARVPSYDLAFGVR